MKLLEGFAIELEVMGMTAGVAGAIMGCWCVKTAGIAIAIAGKLGTGGVGNWLRMSTLIAGSPLWNKRPSELHPTAITFVGSKSCQTGN